tara:strand:- start:324 stop:524 length:201 start_codon:yes stop_codon:yes gene_type:complete
VVEVVDNLQAQQVVLALAEMVLLLLVHQVEQEILHPLVLLKEILVVRVHLHIEVVEVVEQEQQEVV